ncbi:uncharacterized protein IAS62_001014 [Cryptococcus decagattii]|uniref:Endosomal/vacuolar adapter protein YPT35 n=1 Tax=Cryptococcus decagattii TaxID=1859122 RepID=A0ABZ2APA2_9TREE
MSPSGPPTTSASSCLSLLPHSPASSHSSLAFEEASFNYDDPPENENSQKDDNTLETGDLVRTHEGKARDTRNDEDGRHEMGFPGNRRKIGIKLFEGRDQRVESPFAREVIIKGWKIVGGESWTDVAKLGAYVVYDIDIKLKDGGKLNILRRYTDFVRLRKALRIKYHHLWQAIPPLPGKMHIAKFSPEFLEERQFRLQRFLKAIILHPEMGQGGSGSIVGSWVLGDR